MRRTLPAMVAIGLVVAACGSDAGGIAVDDPWARTSAMAQTAGAVYMGLTADDADALVGVSVDASVAAVAELHETVEEMTEDTTSDDDMDHGGMMSMSPVEEIPLPAGESVLLEPGGYHVMLLDLAEPLEDGTTFELTLEFASGESRTIEVEVRDS